MIIDWSTTLALVDARLLAVSGGSLSTGQQVRSLLAGTGSTYSRYFPPVQSRLDVESSAHKAWLPALAAQITGADQVARLAEAEAVSKNGSLIVNDQVLAPAVPIQLTSSTPNGPEAVASSMGLRAIDPGALGNSIQLTFRTLENIVTTPASTATSTYTLDGVSHTYVTDIPATTQTTSTPQLEVSLGTYTEIFQNGVLVTATGGKSRLVSGTWLGRSGTANLSGGGGEVTSVKRRLARAAALPGLSDGVVSLVKGALAAGFPAEPSFYASQYYQQLKRSSDVQTREGIAASIAAKALRDKGLAPPLPPMPTYGQIESDLVSALAAAESWLAIA